MAKIYEVQTSKNETHAPSIHQDSFLAETAQLIGDVTIDQGASIWFGAVLRGDIENIYIGENSNVQDNTVIHTELGQPCFVDSMTTIGHNAVLHGCHIGKHCMIGMGAIVLNGAKIEDHCLIGAGAVIPENMIIEQGSLVVGIPGRVIRQLKPEEKDEILANTKRYMKNTQIYKKTLKKA